jgi:DNA-binding NarL/FixJ family response regulator
MRLVAVADNAPAMARLTASLGSIDGVEIARRASGRHPIGPLVRKHGATLVVIGEMRRRGLALERLAEIHAVAPGTPVVVLDSDPGADWLGDALRAGAAAVVPGVVDVQTLGIVLREAVVSGGPRRSAPALVG